jgi:nitrite reductase/ring-hydroxylating ferredoxin subunit
MSTPAWILEIFAAVMILVAEASAGQLVMARAWTRHGGTDADIAISRLLMGIAMAGILVPGLSALPNAVWKVVFAVMTAWFAWRLWRENRGRGAVGAAHGRHAPHLVQSAAMLYLFAALAAPSAAGSGTSMPGMGGMSGIAGGSSGGLPTLRASTLALIFALLLIAFTVLDLDRRAGAAHTAGRLVLSPAVVKGCQVAIGVTMAFILIIMILVRQQHFVILHFGIVRCVMAGELPSRRALLAGAGVTCAAVLAGCTTHDASNGGSAPATSGAATSAASAPAAAALAATSQVPDGGGKIIDGINIVITQPQSGSFKAFSAICTHQGCIVNSVSNGTINCPCHGSKFSIKDGSVVNGPATRPLPAIAIKVEGTSILQA